VGRGFEEKEETFMKCHVCGSNMKSVVTNLPFKVNETTIVILKELPVLQCKNCSEYLLDDPVMKRVDEILEKVDTSAELEVIKYAA
jgi:YgiT-type zinc finger domain-containing protein